MLFGLEWGMHVYRVQSTEYCWVRHGFGSISEKRITVTSDLALFLWKVNSSVSQRTSRIGSKFGDALYTRTEPQCEEVVPRPTCHGETELVC